MAQSVPPGDIATQPNAKVVFNAPYDDKHTYHVEVINSSARRIGWAFKTTNMKRLGVDPPCGVLDPKEAALIAVSCDAFAYGQEDTNNDRITIAEAAKAAAEAAMAAAEAANAAAISVYKGVVVTGEHAIVNVNIGAGKEKEEKKEEKVGREWFQGDGMVRRKNLPIEYNP